jgi:hypothetical protein
MVGTMQRFCSKDATCGGGVCDLGIHVCRGCASDGECVARGAKACHAGACVECAVSADCGAGKPVCDAQALVCRGCAGHDECASRVCGDDGACVAPGSVLYVDGKACAAGADGSAAAPYCKVTDALAHFSTQRSTVHIAPGDYPGSLDLSNTPGVRVVGRGSRLLSPQQGDSAIRINKGAAFLEGINVVGPQLMGDALHCDEAELHLKRVTVSSSAGLGLSASFCSMTIDQLTVVANRGGGANLNGSSFNISNSLFAENGSPSGLEGGLTASLTMPGKATLTNVTIADNLAAPGRPAGLDCGDGLVVANSIVWNGVAGACAFSASDTMTPAPGPGNLSADPLFAAPGDYHLKPQSPCAQAGSSQGAPDHDLDGTRRGSASVSIGAFEAPHP